jgi:hypothetical protein
LKLLKGDKTMQKFFRLVGALALLTLGASTAAQATPLRLEYAVTPIGGGLFNYEFDLILDNNDGTWVAGQGWSWLVFGDTWLASSPLSDFVPDPSDFPVGPWTFLHSTSGGHNGPTFGLVGVYWVPLAIGETLNWSGTSAANLAQGDLLFSTLQNLQGGVLANLEVAHLVPEPSTALLVGLGLAGMAAGRRRGRD